LQLLNQYRTQLAGIPARNFREYDQNYLVHKASERLLQTAIEACLDIGKHLIAREGFRFAEDSQQVFAVLGEEQVVPAELVDRLKDMARFRNLLVHEYAKIENETVYGILKKRLGDFDEFANAVVAYVDRLARNSKPKGARERRGKYAVRKRKTVR
jgi:uncharacterized protein YutE (UPF0331/DUF86 family)